jgi:phage shock protein C
MPGASRKLLHKAAFFDRVVGADGLAPNPRPGLFVNRMQNRSGAERAGGCRRAALHILAARDLRAIRSAAASDEGARFVRSCGVRVGPGKFPIAERPWTRQARSMTENITDSHAVRRLERSSSDRMLAGVCGGLGRYFELNPTVFRVGFVVLTLLGGAGVLVYLAAVLVMPGEGRERSVAEQVLAERKERPWPLIGLAIVAVALIVLLSRAALRPAAGAGWVFVLVIGVVVLWVSRSARWRGRLLRVLLVLVVATLAAFVTAIVLAFSWFNVSLSDGVGEHVYAPATVAAIAPSYRLGVGNLRIDLSGIQPAGKELQVKAKVGVGELRIVVPNGARVQVYARAKLGDVHVLRLEDSGRNAIVTTGSGGGFVIDARVGLGRIDVVRAG